MTIRSSAGRWILDLVFLALLMVSGVLIIYYFDRPPVAGRALPEAIASVASTTPSVSQRGLERPKSPPPKSPPPESLPPESLPKLQRQGESESVGSAASKTPVQSQSSKPIRQTARAASPPQPATRSGREPTVNTKRTPPPPPDLGRTATDLYRVVIE